MENKNSAPILEVKDVTKVFVVENKEFQVIQNVSFSVNEEEFVGIIGPSGCGKSTLLRIINGMIHPSEGNVTFKGREVLQPTDEMSFVFQTFALVPWLTVEQNVELGLDSLSMSEEEKKERVSKYIRFVGLDGFEKFYPREVSGGMRQRVGLARALVREPSLLLMDEPLSSLDELTARGLRDLLIRLVKSPETPVEAGIIVSHNVEEVVYLVDKVVVLSGRPAKVVGEVIIDLPRPRKTKERRFFKYVDKIISLIS